MKTGSPRSRRGSRAYSVNPILPNAQTKYVDNQQHSHYMTEAYPRKQAGIAGGYVDNRWLSTVGARQEYVRFVQCCGRQKARNPSNVIPTGSLISHEFLAGFDVAKLRDGLLEGGDCALPGRLAAIATKVGRPFGPERPFSLYAANSLQ